MDADGYDIDLDLLRSAHPAIKAGIALLLEALDQDALTLGEMLETVGLGEDDARAINAVSDFVFTHGEDDDPEGRPIVGEVIALVIGVITGAMLTGESQRPRPMRRRPPRPPSGGKGAAGGRRRHR